MKRLCMDDTSLDGDDNLNQSNTDANFNEPWLNYLDDFYFSDEEIDNVTEFINYNDGYIIEKNLPQTLSIEDRLTNFRSEWTNDIKKERQKLVSMPMFDILMCELQKYLFINDWYSLIKTCSYLSKQASLYKLLTIRCHSLYFMEKVVYECSLSLSKYLYIDQFIINPKSTIIIDDYPFTKNYEATKFRWPFASLYHGKMIIISQNVELLMHCQSHVIRPIDQTLILNTYNFYAILSKFKIDISEVNWHQLLSKCIPNTKFVDELSNYLQKKRQPLICNVVK